MRDRQDHPSHIGPFRLVGRLADGRVGQRWVALHERDRTNHLLYRLEPCRDNSERRETLATIDEVSRITHAHALPIERYSLEQDGCPWVVAPYPGNQGGLVTLADVLEAKGGRLPAFECERTLDHLLSAVMTAHERGVVHGAPEPDELLVDRHGSVLIELYGLANRLRQSPGVGPEVVRDEVRSFVLLGYTLLTGLPPEEPMIRASRIVRRLPKGWDAWFERGLDPAGGFASAREARDALPGRAGVPETPAPVVRAKGVLGRFRKAGRGGAEPLR
ncbi:MAG: hypothetical protein R3B57_08565 [Phycisphaerales bacterium]